MGWALVRRVATAGFARDYGPLDLLLVAAIACPYVPDLYTPGEGGVLRMDYMLAPRLSSRK